ncbi:hypothetical protein [Isoptericola sp. G70]|uniref:hypothetical protein n=1 Tax=Isoptericola sp. G70 TaxID=3376633 RepID=UPI003A7FFBDA
MGQDPPAPAVRRRSTRWALPRRGDGGPVLAAAPGRDGAHEARIAWIAERADRAFYVVNARNAASVALHERWGFREVARAAAFHGVTFAGGAGVLLAADVSGW